MLSHQRLIRIFPSSNLINNFNTKINQIIDIKIIQTHHNDNVVFYALVQDEKSVFIFTSLLF